MDENSWVPAAVFSFPIEAEIARSRLDAEGITAFIADANTINMQWLYSDAMGGVRLMVKAGELEKAQNILNTDYSSLVDEAFSKTNDDECPLCGGLQRPFTEGKKPAYLVFILLGFPLFFYHHGMKCTRCGHFEKK